MSNNYPVVFFVFKRPSSTRRFLDSMVSSGITKIYIFADGPRDDKDILGTKSVRREINSFEADNPKITVISTYSPVNLGLKQNIIHGLNTVFAKEKAAIIVEDDCEPTQDFFRFTTQMLTRYENESKIMAINGTSTGGKFKYSYDFSRYPQCWGWATWARAWKLYDSKLTKFTAASWRTLSDRLHFGPLLSWYWFTMLTMVKAGWIKTWDFQWSYAHFYHDALAVAPSANLIKNIGFDDVATNTKTKSKVADLPTTLLTWPLTHPPEIAENRGISAVASLDFYLNPVAIAGLMRQYIYWKWDTYANRH